MVVDDRVAIIGSANINERSQRGDRDSELACIIRDNDMVNSTMAGRPYKVGRFAHTLRVRLMREHLGVDTDGAPSFHGVWTVAADARTAMEQSAAEGDLLSRPPVTDEKLHFQRATTLATRRHRIRALSMVTDLWPSSLRRLDWLG